MAALINQSEEELSLPLLLELVLLPLLVSGFVEEVGKHLLLLLVGHVQELIALVVLNVAIGIVPFPGGADTDVPHQLFQEGDCLFFGEVLQRFELLGLLLGF